ncbi:RDD family protein [Streptomyces sp. NBC_00234]|uniref:RDD family protein n=1 Tax=Streptomyces sp. NBC_00234 TaxID=2903638 RepID=UPI002E28C960|nr:RDD family protein [Streptomyces sp. NBC_00234]
MSAPTPAPGDDSPREGYYPDPSIPGYVRYWNGVSWVPGTSRPAPQQGETAPAPPPAEDASAPAQRAASVEETGPVFFDEVDDVDEVHGSGAQPAAGGRTEPAPAWQADTSRQTGFGGDRDRRVSWGGQQAQPAPDAQNPADRAPVDRTPGPRTPADRAPVDPRRPAPQDPTGGALPGMRDGGAPVPDGTMGIRSDRPADAPRPPADGTVTIRATGSQGAGPNRSRDTGPAPADGTMTIRAVGPGATPQTAAPAPAQRQGPSGTAQPPQTPQARNQAPAAPAPAPVPPALQTPLTPGPGGGSASWAQQVHQLAQPERTAPAPQQLQPQQPQGQQQSPQPAGQGLQGGRSDQPVVPWKPPVDDHFQQLARAQTSARPAGLGKRLAARLLDTVVLGAVVGAVGFPLVTQALDHIDEKIEAAKQSGETVTVWLVDSTTAGLFGGVLGAFLVLGFLLEALPTAKWGRTLGKKLCGLEVRDIESHGPPTVGAALRRWLVYGVLGILVVGVLNVLWCLIDRPWRQCWHDKAARTFVAG